MITGSKWLNYCTGEYKGLEDKYGNPSPYFRKTFTVEKKLKKASLLIAALGVFKVYINGQEVMGDYLSPGWTDYRKQIPLVEYDITHLLQERNAVGVVLGDGWAVGHIGSTTTFKRTSWSDMIEFVADIRLEFEDGTKEIIGTDNSWKATQGAIRRSDIYMGEYVDSRLDVGNFSHPDYDDSAWDPAEETVSRFPRNPFLKPVTNPRIVVKHTFKPTLMKQEGNLFLYDVGQNMSGVMRCVLEGARGAKVVIRHGELVVDGKLYTENLRKAEATDTYILSGNGEEVFRPLFTFHGFQFFEITTFGDVKIKDLTAEMMYTDLKATGSFSCSDPMINKVYQNALWSQRDNFLDVPTDCPQRDERLGWTADAQIISKSAMYNMDCRVFFKKYMQDVRDAQLGNGVIPIVAPLPCYGFRNYSGFDCTAGWAEAIGEIPCFHYLMYGDKTIIRDNLPAVKRLLEFYQYESPDFIRDYLQKTVYADWLNSNAPTDPGVISTLYYARCAYDAAVMCNIMKDEEEDIYWALYENIKNAFRSRYIAEDGKILSDTQSAYLISYAFGIISAEEAKPHLQRKLKEDNGHLTSGFLGIKFLLPVLCDLGMIAEAYGVLTYKEFPGWCYSVIHGATTIWEHWDSYTTHNGIRTGMNSFNHYYLGSCTEWMYEYCLGIHPHWEAPGFQKVTFRPFPDPTGAITWAKGHYDTDFGRIEAQWNIEKDIVTYVVTVPQEIDYSFDFGAMEQLSHTQEGDTHTFTLQM